MPYFINPLKKHDVSEFEGVYEPLSESRRHPSVVAAQKEKARKVFNDSKSVEEGESPPPEYSAFTVEGLKLEIDSDIAASGHDSIYDRM